jgi:chorismate synthase
MQIEKDAGEILSGIRLGETLGSPVAVWIPNRDHDNWRVAMSVDAQPEADDEALRRVYLPRPGHADLVGLLKFDRTDARDILERSSARETSARVAAGSVARRLLAEFGIEVGSHVVRIGDVKAAAGDSTAPGLSDRADKSDVRCLDGAAANRMREAIRAAGDAGDTLGGVFELVATGLPVGLGSYMSWDRRLDGRIGAAMLGIQAMKGVEIGLGFQAATLRGSDVHDEIEREPTWLWPAAQQCRGARRGYHDRRAPGRSRGDETSQFSDSTAR